MSISRSRKNHREKLASQIEAAHQEKAVERPLAIDREMAREQETVSL